MPRFNSKKVLLSVAALGTAGAIAGLGTFAAYTSTTSGSASVTTGVVAIALATDGTGNRLDVPATHVLPGDTVARVVDLSSTSTDPLSSVKLTTTAPTVTSALNTDATNGLQLLVQSCSSAWTETSNSPDSGYSYTCGGTTSTVLSSAAVVQANSVLGNLAATTTAGNVTATVDHLLITMTLPSGTTQAQVPNGATSTIVFTFNALQRTATNR
ncbi:MAG: spore coat-associated protein [Actinomycetota bacterium]|jgi:hypothetical protein|nr:spore coat-associated protein [Actinomycetota bacterium]